MSLKMVWSRALALVLVLGCLGSFVGATTQSGVSEISLPSLPTDTLCPVCLAAVPDLLGSLTQNSTDQDIENALNKVCDILPEGSFKTDCLNAVQDVVALLDQGGVATLSKYSPNAVCSAFSICVNECCEGPNQPEQIHIAISPDPTIVRVSWATLNPTQSLVQWTTQLPDNYATTWDNLAGETNGTRFTWTSGGWKGWIHTATMTGLTPDTLYYYRVGDPSVMELFHVAWDVPLLSFRTPPLPSASAVNRTINVALYADVGASDVSDPVIRRLLGLRDQSGLDFVIHNGDISYADGFESLNDQFMRKIEPLAAYVPYMVTPGNHEDFFNFKPYLNRFSIMPWEESNATSPMYYSFDYGLIHVVAFSTEAPLGMLADLKPGSEQYEWLAADLDKANANRENVPWIIATCHRPLYCTNTGVSHACTKAAPIFREEIEDLLYKSRVDLVVTGHVHAYERTYPVYQNQTTPSYDNPTAPVYLLNGAGGNKEQLEHNWYHPQEPWSAVRMAIYGYSMLHVYNSTTLTWDFIAANNGSVVDTFTINKDPQY